MKNLLFVFVVILLDVMGCGKRHYEEPDYLNVSPDALILENKKGASDVISISSNVYWTVVTNNGEWLEIYPNSGNGDGKIKITAQSNESTFSRQCKLVIVGGQITREIVVFQRSNN